MSLLFDFPKCQCSRPMTGIIGFFLLGRCHYCDRFSSSCSVLFSQCIIVTVLTETSHNVFYIEPITVKQFLRFPGSPCDICWFMGSTLSELEKRVVAAEPENIWVQFTSPTRNTIMFLGLRGLEKGLAVDAGWNVMELLLQLPKWAGQQRFKQHKMFPKRRSHTFFPSVRSVMQR